MCKIKIPPICLGSGCGEPAARRMLSIWSCRGRTTGPTRAGSRTPRPLTLSFIHLYIHMYNTPAFTLILATLGDDIFTSALKKSCRIMTPEIISRRQSVPGRRGCASFYSDAPSHTIKTRYRREEASGFRWHEKSASRTRLTYSRLARIKALEIASSFSLLRCPRLQHDQQHRRSRSII
ncbi:hypothetical protein PUN28_017046 [Cardiocondyla obscurior]|uniref:Uncharacterized protein n=1 Tax=Cardiocondyla obscurior TaxID=286306 RepID=A0AAW2EQF7_9HYME